MRLTLPICLIFAAVTLLADDPKLPFEQNSNENVDISGTLILGREDILQALGVKELPANLESLILVRVSVRPLTEKPMDISLDNFTLLCTKDGQRSKPFGPSEIAGASTLVVKRTTSGGQVGLGGGFFGLGVGNAAPPETVKATVEEKKDEKESPLMGTLKEKIMPEKASLEPVSGLLYFEIDGKKLKRKDFELLYHGPGGRLAMRFRPNAH